MATASSPQGWLNDSPLSYHPSQSEETDEQLKNEAMAVIESFNQNQSTPSPPPMSATTHPISENVQTMGMKVSDTNSLTKKRTRKDYESDLNELNESKTKVMKLEHALLKARYGVQTLEEAFISNYLKPSASTPDDSTVHTPEPSVPLAQTTSSMKTTNPSRGYSNYHAFMKICKTILPGSLRIKRSYFKALWQHQKTSLTAFFKANGVSSADGKAMNDNDAYTNHVTKVVAPLMKQSMPYYTRMILLYDSNATESENLTHLSSLCALPLFVQIWANSTLSTNQDLLENIWNAFGGLIDLQCQQHHVSAMFSETLTDESSTFLTKERLQTDIAPSIAKAMPFLHELVGQCAENPSNLDIQALVIEAKKKHGASSLHG